VGPPAESPCSTRGFFLSPRELGRLETGAGHRSPHESASGGPGPADFHSLTLFTRCETGVRANECEFAAALSIEKPCTAMAVLTPCGLPDSERGTQSVVNDAYIDIRRCPVSLTPRVGEDPTPNLGFPSRSLLGQATETAWYQPRTRNARSVFHRLGLPEPSSMAKCSLPG